MFGKPNKNRAIDLEDVTEPTDGVLTIALITTESTARCSGPSCVRLAATRSSRRTASCVGDALAYQTSGALKSASPLLAIRKLHLFSSLAEHEMRECDNFLMSVVVSSARSLEGGRDRHRPNFPSVSNDPTHHLISLPQFSASDVHISGSPHLRG